MSGLTYKFEVDTVCTTCEFDYKGNGLGNGPDITVKAGVEFTPETIEYSEEDECWLMWFERTTPGINSVVALQLGSTTKPTLVK